MFLHPHPFWTISLCSCNIFSSDYWMQFCLLSCSLWMTHASFQVLGYIKYHPSHWNAGQKNVMVLECRVLDHPGTFTEVASYCHSCQWWATQCACAHKTMHHLPKSKVDERLTDSDRQSEIGTAYRLWIWSWWKTCLNSCCSPPVVGGGGILRGGAWPVVLTNADICR